ncbi:MAG TPA: RNA polymerase sigma factor [Candidatus Polarisedimenticolia bacterium]|nr:RNA polymerase sigma factor [Candidatus Polarisedimenticolia bacterium]
MVEADSDNSIMLRVRDGHLEDLGVLFERHHVRLLNFFMKMTGDRAVSEDLVQESFTRILRYRQSFRGDQGDFVLWMYRLGRSVMVDHFRRSARGRTTELDEGLALDEPSALDRIQTEESARLLQQAILDLSPEKREVLVLHRFHLKSFSEIAGILDCTVGAAKTRAHRALLDLRKFYLRRRMKEAR